MPLRDWACACVGGTLPLDGKPDGPPGGPQLQTRASAAGDEDGPHAGQAASRAPSGAGLKGAQPPLVTANATAATKTAGGGVDVQLVGSNEGAASRALGSRGGMGSSAAVAPAQRPSAGLVNGSVRATVDSPSEMNGGDPAGGSSGSWPSRWSSGGRTAIQPRAPPPASPFATVSGQLPTALDDSGLGGVPPQLRPGLDGLLGGGDEEQCEASSRAPPRWLASQGSSGTAQLSVATPRTVAPEAGSSRGAAPAGGADANSVFSFMSQQQGETGTPLLEAVTAPAEGESRGVGLMPPAALPRGILQPLGPAASGPLAGSALVPSAARWPPTRPALRHSASASALLSSGRGGGSNGVLKRLTSSGGVGSGTATPLSSRGGPPLAPSASGGGALARLLTHRANSRGAGIAASGAASLVSACSSSSASLFAAAHTRAWSAPPPTPPPPTSDSTSSRVGAASRGSSGHLAEQAAAAGAGAEPWVAAASGAPALGAPAQGRRMPWNRRSAPPADAGSRSLSAPAAVTAAAPAAADDSPAAVGASFAAAFIAALEAGDSRWASAPEVAALFDSDARLVGLDRSLHVGKMAVLRRLNGAMEQFVKMVGAHSSGEGGNSSSQGEGTGADGLSGGADGTVDAGVSGAGPSVPAAAGGAYAAAVKRMACSAPPTVEVTLPDPTGRPGSVSVRYAFRFGIRRFAMRDSIVVKRGAIVRLRRSRD